jgi:outer membrane protein OmpA-like peptidoglycan-associated protein
MNQVKFSIAALLLWSYAAPTVRAELPQNYLRMVINSDRDEIQPDQFLTLREAIEVINGQRTIEQLSPAERQQIAKNAVKHQLEFQLPTGNQRIVLNSELPPITVANVAIDGGTSVSASIIQNRKFPNPKVEITPAAGVRIGRGLSLMADNISVRGLSLYGFRVGDNAVTQNIPAADIFIAASNYPQLDGRPAPQNILIENNFLGIRADRSIPDTTSDFGVYVFNSQGTTVRGNAIAHHSASGIISQVSANNLLVENNAIFGNGTQGMPDAIRLEGKLVNNQIRSNLICGNDGSGIFIFKPDSGSVQITDNSLQSNGRRLRRAAIHLMGNHHEVSGNDISFQTGSGISVSAFAQPQLGELPSGYNQISNNRFSQLEGLSIDLVTFRNDGVEDFQDGDGINSQRNSGNRRLDTGNGAINAPRFLAPEFYLLNNQVNLDGQAEPGAAIEIYQVLGDSHGLQNGPLSKLLTRVNADNRGRFSATLPGVTAGTRLSAIASLPNYGTSEPAANVVVNLPGKIASQAMASSIPGDCSLQAAQTPPADPTPTPVPTPSDPPTPPAVTKIEIPSKVHFALDKSYISPASAKLLDEIVAVLKAHPYISIDLAGHTDPRAPQAYNQALGLRRATAVRNYLLKKGIAPQRMTIRSLSFRQRASNDRGVNPYALDRRVEFEYRDIRGGEVDVVDRFDDLQPER